MKRSEINEIVEDSRNFFAEMNFKLPEWSDWALAEWKKNKDSCSEIFENQLGWDITDFGSGNLEDVGLILFTVRNGNYRDPESKPYAEKIMIVGEGQLTPTHHHKSKVEDIINRGGGNLVLELWNLNDDGSLADTDVEVKIDSVDYTFKPGERVVLEPGQSICLYQGLYHRFYGEEGKGRVMVGEISAVNDDEHDNYFLEDTSRFPEIDEDVEPEFLLVSDYKKFLL